MMSFDNLNKKNEGKRANLFLLIFLTALSGGLMLFGMFFPLASLIGLSAAAVPATVLLLTARKRDALICAIAGSVFLFLLNVLFAVFWIGYILAAAFLYQKLYRAERAPYKIIFSLGLTVILLFLLYMITASLIGGSNLFLDFMSQYREALETLTQDPQLLGLAQIAAINEAQLETMINQSKEVLLFLPYILPSILAVFAIVAGLINYHLAIFFLGRYQIPLKRPVFFSQWDLPWYYCWGIIFGLVFVLLPNVGPLEGRILDIVGYNLLILFGVLYTVLGFSVMIGIFKKYHWNMIVRWIIIFILLFTGIILIVPLLGLADIWINIRRLKRK